jgi:hypothetical protein
MIGVSQIRSRTKRGCVQRAETLAKADAESRRKTRAYERFDAGLVALIWDLDQSRYLRGVAGISV